MKSILFASLTSAVLVAGCTKPEEQVTTAEMPAASAPMEAMAPSTKSATAIGTIKAIDATSGKITLAHGPVPELEWPAMTMAFKATPDQIASVKVEQKVQFEFEAQGMDATITKISAAP